MAAKKPAGTRGGAKKATGAKKKLGVKKTPLDLDAGQKEVYGGWQKDYENGFGVHLKPKTPGTTTGG
jgi:hypothetical protein